MEIPKRPGSRWDGDSKYKTKNCESCSFYRKIENKKLCGWGIVFKYLIEKEKPRKCEVKNRNMTKNMFGMEGEHSVKYLDKIIKENIK